MIRYLFSARISAVLLIGLLAVHGTAAAPTRNGFDLYGALVSSFEIVSGGPPRDGIPALKDPTFVTPPFTSGCPAC